MHRCRLRTSGSNSINCNAFVVVTLIFLFGCAEPALEVERPSDLRLLEIGRLAETQLGTVESDTEWVTAALELSVALRASDDAERADELLSAAGLRAAGLQDPEQRAIAVLAVGRDAPVTLHQAESAIAAIDDNSKRWDLHGKLASAWAANGRINAALEAAVQMPEDDDTLASYKARTLQEIAGLIAKQNDVPGAVEALSLIKTGLPYYQVKARTEVAVFASSKGQNDLAIELLQAASSVARTQTDGYFVAGALRQVAVAYAETGDETTTTAYFADALEAARDGLSPQHQARALSRIATSMADLGRYAAAVAVLPEAIEIAESESREAFRLWAFYELAGAAAFCGDFSTARRLLESIPADFEFGSGSLRAAAERDVAWGLVRHAKVMDGRKLAMAIDSPRERVQALSRIMRVLADPEMKAMPRYL